MASKFHQVKNLNDYLHYSNVLIRKITLSCILGEGDITALYSNACLMEHNCSPNVKYKFNMEDFKITVESSLDIKR